MSDSYSGVVLLPNGHRESLRWNRSTEYEVIRAAVGGWLEVQYSVDGKSILWFDEEGLLKDLPINPVASLLWARLNPNGAGQALRGRVVVTGRTQTNDGAVATSALLGIYRTLDQIEGLV